MYLSTFGFIGWVVGTCIMCCILISSSASDTKRDYENRIEQLDRWYEKTKAKILD